MADSNENALKVLISFGLNDAAAKEAIAQLDQLKSGAGDAAASTDELAESGKKEAEVQDLASTRTKEQFERRRELRRALDELNRVLPGLGEVANMAAIGFIEAAKGEETMGEAATTLVDSLGPIALVMLSIQAAVEYWKMFSDAAKESAEEVGKATEKIIKDTQAALDVWQKYQDVLSGKKEVTKPFEEELENRKAIQQAEYESSQKVLEAQKAGALSQATTPEQKAKVDSDFATKAEALRQQNENAQQDIMQSVRNEVQKAMLEARAKSDAAHQDQVDILRLDPKLKLGQDRDDLNKSTEEEKKQTDAVQKLQDMFESLGGKLDTAIAVQQVEISGGQRVRATQAVQPNDTNIAEGVQAIVERQHGHFNKSQNDALARLNDTYERIFGNTDLLTQALTYAHQHALNQQQEIQLLRDQIKNLTHVQ